jgi:hypothetical protein
MASWFHTAILATGIVATVAVGFASASMLATINTAAPKGDRVAFTIADNTHYTTVETLSPGGSTLMRVQAD